MLGFSTSMTILSREKSLSSIENFLTLGYVMEDYLRKSIRTCSQCGRKFNVSQCGSSSGLYLFICSRYHFTKLIYISLAYFIALSSWSLPIQASVRRSSWPLPLVILKDGLLFARCFCMAGIANNIAPDRKIMLPAK